MPRHNGQQEYSRGRYDSFGGSCGSSGSSHFNEARSLAPVSIAASRSRQSPSSNSQSSSYGSQNSRQERPQYTKQVGHHSAPLGYSEYPVKPASYNSTSLSTSPSRSGSPILLPQPNSYPINGGASTDRNYYNNQKSLPIAYGNSNGNGSYPHSSRPTGSHQQTSYGCYSQRRSSSPPRQLMHPSYASVHQEYAYSSGPYYDRSPFSGGGNGSYPMNFEAISDHGDGKQKRRRGNLPKAVIDTLKSWFTEHIAHPYPTEEEKQILMAKTGLTISQVSRALRYRVRALGQPC